MTRTKTKAGRNSTTKKATGVTNKQQSALERGGSLAQRNSSEDPIGTNPDKPDEITSAAPPNDENLKEEGRASSPSFDEAPVTGKGKTGTKAGPKGQVVKAGDAPVQDKVEDITKLEDLPAGSAVDFRASEVVIHAAIAGGARRSFAGRTAADALAQYNDFAENGPRLFEGAAPGSEDPDQFEAQRKQFDKEALERSRKDLKARGIEAD